MVGVSCQIGRVTVKDFIQAEPSNHCGRSLSAACFRAAFQPPKTGPSFGWLLPPQADPQNWQALPKLQTVTPSSEDARKKTPIFWQRCHIFSWNGRQNQSARVDKTKARTLKQRKTWKPSFASKRPLTMLSFLPAGNIVLDPGHFCHEGHFQALNQHNAATLLELMFTCDVHMSARISTSTVNQILDLKAPLKLS